MLEIGKNTHYQQNLFKEMLGKTGTKFVDTDKRYIIKRYPEYERKKFVEALQRNLFEVLELAKKHGVQLRPDCGSLLGIHRDNALLPWDFDNDTSCLLQDLNLDFVEELQFRGWLKPQRKNFYFKPDELIFALKTGGQFFLPKILKIVTNTHFFDGLIPVMTDIFTWIKVDEKLYSYLDSKMYMVQEVDNVIPLQIDLFNNHKVFKPNNPDAYLADMYGDDWRTPNPTHKDRVSLVRGLVASQNIGKILQNPITQEIRIEPIIKSKHQNLKR